MRVYLFKREAALEPILAPLIKALYALEQELQKLNKRLKKRTAIDPVCRRLMTIPGVGPVTALTCKASIEDPARFRKSRDVGAYVGLTPRRFQSGNMDVISRSLATACCAGPFMNRPTAYWVA